MSRKFSIVASVILFIILLGINVYNFTQIENENQPFFSNKKQFKKIFYTKNEYFNKLAESVKKYDDNIFFHYNSSRGFEQVEEVIHDEAISECIRDIVTHCGMTNVDYMDEYLMVYHYPPIVFSDYVIGARYSYTTQEWDFYYQHDYKRCRHKHPLLYRLYDLFFNNYSKLPANGDVPVLTRANKARGRFCCLMTKFTFTLPF